MASTDQLQTVIEVVNEVRRLIGLNTVTNLTADKHARVAVRLLNSVVSEISNAGDWHEMFASALVTAEVSVGLYSIGVKHPVKNIYEVSFGTDRQALEPIDLSDLMRYARGGGVGNPRRFSIKGVDQHGNPSFAVHPQPGSAQAWTSAGDTVGYFGVVYFKKPSLYSVQDADAEVPFPANLVIAGLYAKALEEEAGGLTTRESLMAYQDFTRQIQEELNRFNADSGSGEDIQMQPVGIR